jgi:isopentenyldiphosphate isomerase
LGAWLGISLLRALGLGAETLYLSPYAAAGCGQWLGRRSSQKPTWPGMLDHIVAGGQPHGISVVDNMRKECEEEASIPAALAQHAVPVGVCSYEYSNAKSLRRDVIFCYDLLLPDSFVPAPLDGEVEEFLLLPVEEVAEIVNNTTSTTPRTAQFKDNCNLVVIDFLVRHGYLTPERPEYLQILKELRTGDWS